MGNSQRDDDFYDFDYNDQEEYALKSEFDRLISEGGKLGNSSTSTPTTFSNYNEREYSPGVDFFKYHRDHEVILNSANNKKFWVCRNCLVEVKK